MAKFSDDFGKNKHKAIELVSRFIEDRKILNGDIRKLSNYSLWGVDKDSTYGNGLSYPDADRTKIVYAIDYLLYYEKLQKCDFNLYGYSTKSSTYSGETLNTFRTLFSSKKGGSSKIAHYYGEENYRTDIFNPDTEKDNYADDFYHIYQRIGNVTLLPCLTVCGGSLNTMKGTDYKIRDYFYPFMENLKKAYSFYNTNFTQDNPYYEFLLLMKKNAFFFDKIKTFKDFVEVFMLEGWDSLRLDEYLRCAEVTCDNIQVVRDYVKKANRFINERSERIVSKLDGIINKREA